MATMPPTSLPSSLDSTLQDFERSLRWRAAFDGLVKLISTSFLLVLGFFVLDAIWPLSATVRFVFLISLLVVMIGMLSRYVLWPLLRPISMVEIAYLIDRSSQKNDERFSSTVELARQSEESDSYMHRRLVKETVGRLYTVKKQDVLAGVISEMGVVLALITLVLALAPLAVESSNYNLRWQRLLSPSANLATATNLMLEPVDPIEVLGRGEDWVAKVGYQWRYRDNGIPDSVWLYWYDESGEQRRRMDYDAEQDCFLLQLSQVTQSLKYSFRAGSSRTIDYQLVVADRPELTDLMLTIQPPAYTGLPASRLTNVPDRIVVLEGSMLSFDCVFSHPVESVSWKWKPLESTDPLTPKTIKQGMEEVTLAEDRLSSFTTLKATQSGTYEFQAKGELGLESDNAFPRTLIVEQDQPPVIDMGSTPIEQDLRPTDRLEILPTVTDDIGIASVTLYWERLGQPDSQGEIPAIIEPGQQKATTPFSVDFASLDAKVGEMFRLRVQAVDVRESPAPHRVWSDDLIVKIDSRADEASMAQLERDQQNLRDMIQALRTKADILHVSLDGGNDLTMDESTEQTRLLIRKSQEAARRLRTHVLYASIGDQLEEIAESRLKNALSFLGEAAKQPNEPSAAKHSAAVQMRYTRDELDALLEKFDKLSDLEKDLQELQDLANQAERLAQRAQQLDQMAAQQDGQIDPVQETQRNQLQADVGDLQDELETLLTERPELIEAAKKFERQFLEQLSKQAEQLAQQQSRLQQQLSESDSDILRGLPRELAQVLQKALDLSRDSQEAAVRLPSPALPRDTIEAIAEATRSREEQAANTELQNLDELLAEKAEQWKQQPSLSPDHRTALQQLAQRQREIKDQIKELDNQQKKKQPVDEQTKQKLAEEIAGVMETIQKMEAPRQNEGEVRHMSEQLQHAMNDLAADRFHSAANRINDQSRRSDNLARQLPEMKRQGKTTQSLTERLEKDLTKFEDRLEQLAQAVRAGEDSKEVNKAFHDLQQAQNKLKSIGEQTQNNDQLPKETRAAAESFAKSTVPNNRGDLNNERIAELREQAKEMNSGLQELKQQAEALQNNQPVAESVASRNPEAAQQDRKALQDRVDQLQKRQQQLQQQTQNAETAEQQKQLANQQKELAKQISEATGNSGQTAQQLTEAFQKAMEASEQLSQSTPEQAEQNQSAVEQAQKQVEQALDQIQQRLKSEAEQMPAPNEIDVDSLASPESLAQRAEALRQELAAAQQAAQQSLQMAENSSNAPSPNSPQANNAQNNNAEAMASSPSANSGKGTAAEQPQSPEPSIREVMQQQQQLAREASALAGQAAMQMGIQSDASKQQTEFAEQATASANSASVGELNNAAQQATEAANTAQQASDTLGKVAQSERPDLQPLAARAQELASRQQRLADQLQQGANDAEARLTAQIEALNRLTQMSEELANGLAESQERLESKPFDQQQASQQAGQAASQAQQGSQQSGQASDQAQQGQLQQASGQSGQSAQSLQQAAQSSQSAAGMLPGSSSVNPELGSNVSEATRQLQQASGQMSANPQSSTQSNGNSSQGQSSPLAPQLQQAADALRKAADQLNQQGSQAVASGKSSAQGNGQSTDGLGMEGFNEIDFEELESLLHSINTRNWGQLPSTLQSDISQSRKSRISGQYQGQIKKYFEAIGGAETGESNE